MSIVELSISNWNDEVLLADTLVIIEFWHDTCTRARVQSTSLTPER